MSDSLDKDARTAALEVLTALRDAGHEAYFAGGSVRDDVMGRTPKDFDVTTSATPPEVMELFERCVAVGAQFGVIVVLNAGHEVEVATFRTESGYADGRRPDQVTWASAREDVLRRDFTINGLLGDPLATSPEARVIDHVGGLSDLEAGLVRAIGEPTQRFAEDQLRLLRAIRFAARLEFRIEEDTWFAIRALADTIANVSAERTRDELERMLTEGGALRAWRLLKESDLLGHVVTEAPSLEAVEARLKDSELTSVQAWVLVLLDAAPLARVIDAWAGRLRISNALARKVQGAIAVADALKGYEQMSVPERKRLVRRSEFATGAWAADTASEAGQRPPGPVAAARADLAQWDDDALNPAPLINGGDLRALGYAPGPGFKHALEAVEDAQLAGTLSDKDGALALASQVLDTP